MTIAKVEEYRIGKSRFGIEDLEDGRPDEEHFVSLTTTRRRFTVWRNGCGTGQFDNIEEAREHVLCYALRMTCNELEIARQVVKEMSDLNSRLALGGLKEFFKDPDRRLYFTPVVDPEYPHWRGPTSLGIRRMSVND